MQKSTILRYFTVAMIILFVAEIFFIGVNSGSSNDSAPTATPPVASVAPVESFVGNANAQAQVTGLGDELLVMCNSTSAAPVVRAFEKVQSVSYDPSSALLDVRLYAKSDAAAIARDIRSSLSGYCDASVLRFSILSFGDAVEFASADNKTRSVPARGLNCFSDGSGRCFALLSPQARVGDNVTVSMFITLQGGQLERLLVQESAPLSEMKSVFATGEVTSVSGQIAFAQLPWARRSLDENKTRAAALGAGANVSQFNYFPDSSIVLPALDNETLALVGNLSFVKSVSPREGLTYVFVDANFSNESAAAAALAGAGVNATPEFPASRLSLAFDSGNWTRVSSSLEEFLGVPVQVKRSAQVRLLDVAAIEEELRASFGNETNASVLVGADFVAGSRVSLAISAYTAMGAVISFSAQATSDVPLAVEPQASATPVPDASATPSPTPSGAAPSPAASPSSPAASISP